LKQEGVADAVQLLGEVATDRKPRPGLKLFEHSDTGKRVVGRDGQKTQTGIETSPRK